ncbi:hypothetical protein AusDCA_0540 [Desulfitobacterium sp. AusDCA]
MIWKEWACIKSFFGTFLRSWIFKINFAIIAGYFKMPKEKQ